MELIRNPLHKIEQDLSRIEAIALAVEEMYCVPKENGVINIFVPLDINDMLHQRLIYLQENDSGPNESKRKELIQKLKGIGQITGFDERGVINSPNSDEIDLANYAPSKEGKPFFIWDIGQKLKFDLDCSSEIEPAYFLERKIGPISMSGRGLSSVGLGDGVTMFTPTEKTIHTHGLSFYKRFTKENTSTFLSFDCGWSFIEGFTFNISFCFDEKGKIISTYYGRDKSDIDNALAEIETINVSPQHLLYYIVNSNLSEKHRSDISELIEKLSSYPTIAPHELFNKLVKGHYWGKNKEFFYPDKVSTVDRSKFDLENLTIHYRDIHLLPLTIDEFEHSNLPDNNWISIHLGFKSNSENSYQLVCGKDRHNKYSLFLIGEGKDFTDFSRVENELLKAIQIDEYDKKIYKRQDDICRNYYLAKTLTNEGIVHLARVLNKTQKEVSITRGYYENVAKYYMDAVTLPDEKIKSFSTPLLM